MSIIFCVYWVTTVLLSLVIAVFHTNFGTFNIVMVYLIQIQDLLIFLEHLLKIPMNPSNLAPSYMQEQAFDRIKFKKKNTKKYNTVGTVQIFN